MTSYPPSPEDGDNEQTRASNPQAGSGTGATGGSQGTGGSTAPGQGPTYQQPYPQGYQQPSGGYPQGAYQQGAYQQGAYQQGAYQQGVYQQPYPGQAGGYQAQPGQQPSYYNQPGYPGAYPGGQGGPEGAQPTFFGALFDLNFTRFATPSVIKVLYILIIVVIVLYWLFLTIAGFVSGEPLYGIAAFIGGGVVSLLAITFYRVVLEFFYAVVRMSEDIHNRR